MIIRLLDRGVDELECDTLTDDQLREDEELLRQMTPLEGELVVIGFRVLFIVYRYIDIYI